MNPFDWIGNRARDQPAALLLLVADCLDCSGMISATFFARPFLSSRRILFIPNLNAPSAFIIAACIVCCGLTASLAAACP